MNKGRSFELRECSAVVAHSSSILIKTFLIFILKVCDF